uniref:Rep protein n=1 Tax=Circovirus sp. TaxID=1964372 RepID=A0A4D6J115_9CIRC|nr:rep protein [Circovirus sp.]
MPSFTFHARYGLFTYAQCGTLDPIDVSNHFTSLGAECIVAREDHADGGTHLHVFADFERKRRFRRVDIFDVGSQHPNIVPSRGNPGQGWDYATKDGQIVAGGLERPTNGNDEPNVVRKDAIMAEICAMDRCKSPDATASVGVHLTEEGRQRWGTSGSGFLIPLAANLA